MEIDVTKIITKPTKRIDWFVALSNLARKCRRYLFR